MVDPENLTFSAGALVTGLPDILDTLATALGSPDYTVDQLDRARGRLLRGRPAEATESPGARVWGPPAPAPAGELLDVTPDEVGGVHRKVLRPQGAVLCVAGDVDVDAVVTSVKATFGVWTGPSGEAPRLDLPPRRFPEPSVVERSGDRDNGTGLFLEAPSVPLRHPDHAALHLANLMVAGCFPGRLVQALRQREGLAYSVRSTMHKLRRSDWISISCSGPFTDPAELMETTRVTLTELADRGPRPGELDAVRRYAVGVNRTAARGTGSLAHAVTAYAAHGVSPLWMLAAGERYAGVTEDDVHRVLRSHFTPDRFGGVLTTGRPMSVKSGNTEGVNS